MLENSLAIVACVPASCRHARLSYHACSAIAADRCNRLCLPSENDGRLVADRQTAAVRKMPPAPLQL